MTIEDVMDRIMVWYFGESTWNHDDIRTDIETLVAQARDEEAEACAKVVEAIPKMAAFMSGMPVQDKCAQAIRARIAGRKA